LGWGAEEEIEVEFFFLRQRQWQRKNSKLRASKKQQPSKHLTSPPMREMMEDASAGKAASAMERTPSSVSEVIFVLAKRERGEEGQEKNM